MTADTFRNPDPDAICAALAGVRTIAVVGLSPHPDRPSFRIAGPLQGAGYRIVPVRPLVREVLGERAYGRLAEIPFSVDLVDVFRSADAIDGVVDDCIATRVPRLWVQEGIVNVPAAQRAVAAGVWTVMDRCLWRDLKNLCPGALPRQEAPA